jgi:hypothetical protein
MQCIVGLRPSDFVRGKFEKRQGLKNNGLIYTNRPHPGPLPEGEGSFKHKTGVFCDYQVKKFFIAVYLLIQFELSGRF